MTDPATMRRHFAEKEAEQIIAQYLRKQINQEFAHELNTVLKDMVQRIAIRILLNLQRSEVTLVLTEDEEQFLRDRYMDTHHTIHDFEDEWMMREPETVLPRDLIAEQHAAGTLPAWEKHLDDQPMAIRLKEGRTILL